MTSHHKIIGNEAFDYAAHRLSPAHGSIHMFPSQTRWRAAFAWVRWWHMAGLALSAVLLADRFV